MTIYRTIARRTQALFSVGIEIKDVDGSAPCRYCAAMDRRKFTRVVKQRVRQSASTRVALADRAGLSEAHVRSVEGGTMPSVENADKLLRVLGLRLVIGDPEGENLE